MSQAVSSNDIAIVGMSAMFANGADLHSYWQSILDKVDAVREAPDSWAKPYFDPDSSDSDRIYTRLGGFLGDSAEFNPSEFGIMPNAVDGGEPDQYLALKMATAALKDAGYMDREFDREKTGIILGRGTYVNRGYTNLMQHGMMVDQTMEVVQQVCPQLDDKMLAELRGSLKDSLPPFTPDMSPGLVPNVVSGRIANRLDLRGPNFIIDAACASSLIAIELAIKELLSGRSDMVLAGGIHASTPPQIYMIFCQIAAMSRGKIRPFDSAASGTLLGEGLGILCLRRLADAERDNDRIYAVLKGVGVASDGKALGLLAPRLEGEVLALQRAYQSSGVDPTTVDLVEAHGTGIPLGDQTEISALSQVFGKRGQRLPHTALGSVKSMISHCIPAAGAAAIIKTALALHHKVLPPTLCDEVNPQLNIESTPFYINTESRPWIHASKDHPRRAGVNAFGFGGINSHAILEEYTGPAPHSDSMLNSRWPSELLVLTAADQAGLREQLSELKRYISARPDTELADIAFSLSHTTVAEHRLAIIARDLVDLDKKIDFVLGKFANPDTDRLQTRTGIYYRQAGKPGKVAFLFPGEGAQYPNMLADLCMLFPTVRRWFDLLDQTFPDRENPPSRIVFPAPTSLTKDEQTLIEQQLFDMDLGSETVFIANMALNELLGEFGIKPDAMLGHSTGENAGLLASGIMRNDSDEQLSEKMRHLNTIYEELQNSDLIPRGVLLTVGAIAPEELQTYLDNCGMDILLAIDNCPNQAVLFGQDKEIEKACAELAKLGGLCARLPFDRAYHTPLFERVSTEFMKFYESLDVGPGHTQLYSCATMEAFQDDPAEIRALASSQWSNRVRFRETIEHMYRDGFRVFVEAGPAGNLTSFVQDTLRDSDSLVVASNSRRHTGLEQLQHMLGRLFTQGVDMTLSPMYTRRNLRKCDFAVAESSQASRPKMPLSLEVPRLSVRSDLLETIRKTVRDKTAVADSKVVPIRLDQGVALAPVAQTPQPTQPAAPADPRLQALQGHFEVMNEFLQSQGRVMAMAGGATTGNPVVAAGNPSWPLLGEVLEQTNDELRIQHRVDVQRDLFLKDHTLGSAPSARDNTLLALPVIPFTFSMEIIAEAAAFLLGNGYIVRGMQNLRGYRWLTLDHGVITLNIHAKRVPSNTDEQRVEVRLYQLTETGPESGVLVFEGIVRLAQQFEAPPAVLEIDLGETSPSVLADEHLYRTGMFHGPRLQGVKHLRRWSGRGIEADLETIGLQQYFAGFDQPTFQTDAGLMDAAGQLVGYWLTEQYGSDFNCFPFQVDSFQQFAPMPAAGERTLCRAAIGFTEEKHIRADFDLLDTGGKVIARLQGWQDRHFSIPHVFYECRLNPQTAHLSVPWMQGETGLVTRRVDAFPENFLEDAWAIWKRVLAHIMLNSNERAVWYALPEHGPRRTDWLLGRIAAKDAVRQWAIQQHGIALAPADIEIRANAQGKPLVDCPALGAVGVPEVSITHNSYAAVATASESVKHLGIDVERLDRVRTPDLLQGAFSKSEIDCLNPFQANERERMLIGLWCAKEAAAKAYATGLQGKPMSWQVSRVSGNGSEVIVQQEGKSFVVELWFTQEEAIAVCRHFAVIKSSETA
ncbi:MAG: polyketide synthase dehydratase domain-containing protein [Halioglobus sp.]|nr:polyketide synthase dehydratase domain-containing protein [Halioglobus sp.]